MTREVSLRSGAACANALEGEGFTVDGLDVGRDAVAAASYAQAQARCLLQRSAWALRRGRLHPGRARDARHAYTQFGVLASALAMHKERAKAVLAAGEESVAESMVISRRGRPRVRSKPPYVIDRARQTEGWSVGVYRARGPAPPAPGADLCSWTLGEEVMVERMSRAGS